MASWKPSENAKYGVVIYNFDGKRQHELRLTVGETVHIFEECSGWYRGCTLRNKALKGIFPTSFVHIKECFVEHDGTSYETVSPKEDSTVRELTSVLKEWSVIWKQQYVKSKWRLFEALKKIMWDLVKYRQQLLSGTLPKDQMDEIKKKAITQIDWGNSKMGLDLIPRIDGVVVDADFTSVVELYKVHVASLEASLSASGRGSMSKAKVSHVSTVAHHLYFNMGGFVYNVEERCEVFFSIYDASEKRFISERFMISIGKSDSDQKVNQLQKISKSTCLFTDLGSKDLGRDAYLVAHIIRVGKMLTDLSNKKVSNVSYRRPTACAVLDIFDVMSGKVGELEDREYHMPIYTCNESDFWNVHESIIKKQNSKFSQSGPNAGIYVSMRMLHGELEQIQLENLHMLPKETPVARKLGFPDVIMPGDVRNDVYVTIERGEFEKGSGKTTSKNVEVSMCVIGANGRVIEDCIFLGAGGKPLSEYESMIFYHTGNPKWNETVKVQVPIEKFSGSHLRIGFRHLSKFEEKDKSLKTFGFSFIKLMREDGTTVRDGIHELIVYKFDTNCFYDSKTYFHHPSCHGEPNQTESSVSRLTRNTKDVFSVRTVVCSTKLTENVDLVGLLRWRQHKEELSSVLTSLLKIEGEEIVKFLQDIFDALFCILSESVEQYGHAVFQALVFIICILSNEKYQHFRAVLNTYIEKHFSGAVAHKKLVSCLMQTLEHGGSQEKIEYLKNAMTALEFLFKFIIQSRILYSRSSPGASQEEFLQELSSLFRSLNLMISGRMADLVSVQDRALRNFAGIYQDALKVFTPIKFSYVVRDFLNSVPSDSKASSVAKSRLRCINATVNSDLFVFEDSRKVLLPVFVNHLHSHLVQQKEMRVCAEILGDILTSLQKKAEGSTEEDVYLLVRSLLQTVFQRVMTMNRTSDLARQFLSILINILRIMKESQYQRYLQEFPSHQELKGFLVIVFVVFLEMVKRDIFPGDWMVIKVLANSVILTAIQNFSLALCENFSGENFDYKLWNNYFHLCVAFLTQASLQLENFTEVKKNKVLDRYGDMREVMGFEIVNMWQHLGAHKKYFIPSLIGPFLEMTLVPQTELRRATLRIFFDLVECELRAVGFTSRVENEFVNKLDRFVGEENRGDEEYKDLFHQILADKVEKELEYRDEGLAFVDKITDLLELLLDYRIACTEDSRDRKMICTVNLLEFYRKIDREDMYIVYLNRLCDLHIPAENYTEAGYTILLHAELLEWSDSAMTDKPDSPSQCETKEKLYLNAIEFFDKGKNWEKGIELCKTLATEYESELYDFVKLSNILETQAKFFDNIMKQVRPEPEYFRVAFYGKGFPPSFRNKVFIYRGQEYEKIGEFNQRIHAQFCDAQIMDRNAPPDDDILQSDGQYLQMCRVVPLSDSEGRFAARAVDDRIVSYHRVNNVQKFTYSRPFHKGPKDKSNEFASLWLERTTLRSESALPGILRLSPVIISETEEISPLQNAVETVESKNKELKTIIDRMKLDSSQSINPLSMILNGVIDAAVMGGTAKYQEAFFTPEYLTTNPGHDGMLEQLKRTIFEQVGILQEGLELHEELITKDLGPFHEKMERCFAEMKYRVTGEKVPEKPKEPTKELVMPQPTPVNESPGKTKQDRKMSLPLDTLKRTANRASTLYPRQNRRQSEQPGTLSMWYDSSPSPSSSSSSMSSLFTSSNKMRAARSLEALTETEEKPPPVPTKGSRTPDERRGNSLTHHFPGKGTRNSSPGDLSWLGSANSNKTGLLESPDFPAKRKNSSLLTSDDYNEPGLPPPLPPRISVALSSGFSGSSSELTETMDDEEGPALPEKSSTFSGRFSWAVLSESEVPSSPTSNDDLDGAEDDCPIPLPEKRNSYGSTVSNSASRLISPSVSDVAGSLKLLPDLTPSKKQDRMTEWVSNIVELMNRPLPSPDSTSSPTTPHTDKPGSPGFDAFDYDFVKTSGASAESNGNGNDLITLSSSVEDEFQGNNRPRNGVTANSHSDGLSSSDFRPSSAPVRTSYLRERPPPVAPKTIRNSRIQMSNTNLSQQSETSNTFSSPTSVKTTVVEQTTSQVLLRRAAFEGMASTQFRPTPLPRTVHSDSKLKRTSTLSRSESDASDFVSKAATKLSGDGSLGERRAPPVRPRRSLLLDGPDPPPKPPRQARSPGNRPESAADTSKSADNSPNTSRKAWKS